MEDQGERASGIKSRVARATEDVARKVQTEVGASQVCRRRASVRRGLRR